MASPAVGQARSGSPQIRQRSTLAIPHEEVIAGSLAASWGRRLTLQHVGLTTIGTGTADTMAGTIIELTHG
jgi:hypothetical protein